MKKIRQTLLGLGLASALQAAPILDFQDTFDPAEVKFSPGCRKSNSFAHDNLDDGAPLRDDGKMRIIVKVLYGDYHFKDSRLDAHAVAAVPEPGTSALMGLGLLALGMAVKRRKAA